MIISLTPRPNSGLSGNPNPGILLRRSCSLSCLSLPVILLVRSTSLIRFLLCPLREITTVERRVFSTPCLLVPLVLLRLPSFLCTQLNSMEIPTLSRELISPAPPDLLTSRPLLKVRLPNSNPVSSDLLVASRCSASWMISPCLRLTTGEIRKPLKSSDS